MKNSKAIFLIVLGAFLMATGFAFANEPYNQLKNNPFGDKRLEEIYPVSIPAPTLNRAVPEASKPAEVKPAATATATAAPAAKVEEKKPTMGESIKKFLGENRSTILLTGIGAYLGWALVGTLAGALTGGLFFFAFFALAAM